MSDDIEDFLEHYGVKGMKWGVVNEDDGSGLGSKSKQLERKYGPDSMKDNPTPVEKQSGWAGLSPGQKKAAKILGGTALIAGGAGLAYLYVQNGGGRGRQNPFAQGFGMNAEELARFDATRRARILKDFGKLADAPPSHIGLKTHWNEGVDLPKGTIFKRLSTAKETDIRPKGFFAAFDDKDVQRYKAELPKYWKQWGLNADEGYLVNLRAKEAIRAPSGEKSVQIFKKMLSENPDLYTHVLGDDLTTFSSSDRDRVLTGLAKSQFPQFSGHWANGLDHQIGVVKYFEYVQKEGYNALIDFNDSGTLSKTPMRLLSGSNFELAGHTPVSKGEIKQAQKSVKELVMSIINAESSAFLAHYGVKGMKWGQRKKRTQKESREISKRKSIKAKRRTLSDNDLKAYIDRLEKEKKLKSLIEDDLTPGRKVAKQLMSESGQKVLKTVATGAALYAIKVGVGSKFKASDMKKLDLKEAAGYMAPKPKNK